MSQAANLQQLPADLPVPTDDGACQHLPGATVAALVLPATNGQSIALAALTGRTVVYCYPRTGRPDEALPPGWDDIPGARGCTAESCAFRDHYRELHELGCQVFGLSSQDTEYQREVATRLQLPYPLLSDARLHFAAAMRLPTFAAGGMQLIKRLTLIIDDGTVTHVFYPVFPPDRHATDVVAWLRAHTRSV